MKEIEIWELVDEINLLASGGKTIQSVEEKHQASEHGAHLTDIKYIIKFK